MNKLISLIGEGLNFSLWIKNLDLKYTYVNEIYAKKFNMKVEDFINNSDEEIFGKSYIDNFVYNEVIHSQKIINYTYKFNQEKYSFKILPIVEKNQLTYIAGVEIAHDTVDEKINQMNSSKRLLSLFMNSLPCNLFFKDTKCRYRFVSRASDYYKKTEYNQSVIGKSDLEIQRDKEKAIFYYEDDKKVIKTKKGSRFETSIMVSGEERYYDIIKNPVINEYNNVIGIVGIINDITDRKLLEKKLIYISRRDRLTGVYNRYYYEERLNEIMKEENLPLSIIMGDCNGLKALNDNYGHAQGDLLLIETANLLTSIVNENCEVFRIGGDEFVILCPNTNEEKCKCILEEIYEKSKSKKVNGLPVSISMGYSVINTMENTVEEAFLEAEKLLYEVKLKHRKDIDSLK